MSTENIHGTPPISRENGHVETGFNSQPQTVLESRGPQNEDGSQCTGLSQADGSGDISDQAAAETLVHFRDQISHEANQNRVTINGDIRQHEQSMPYSSTGFWQQRPGYSMGVNQHQTVQYTQASGNSVQNDNVSMDINLQNVIVNMSRTLSSIQQKQDSIQQKQDSMQQKQELFESAFQSVVAVLQEMRSVSLTNNQREASSVPARPALPNELPQNPQREVVSDGSNVSQLCQGNSSISYVQDNVPATLVPRANGSQNSTQDSGHPSTASYHNYVAESFNARSAYRTTSEPVYQESVTLTDARDHAYNMRAQVSDSSNHRNHAWQMPAVTEDRTNTTTNRTIHRDNRVDSLIHQTDRAVYRQQNMSIPQYTERQRVHKQPPVLTNSTDIDTADGTIHRQNERQVYPQHNRIGYESEAYQDFNRYYNYDRNNIPGETTDKTVNRVIDMPNYRHDDRMSHERDIFHSYDDSTYATEKRYQRQESGRQSSYNYGIKLPSFDGKEDWKVWISRFEEIAERRNWDNDMKLDNLLPKLQGRAGDFVFTQLPKYTLRCYSDLVKELNSRFRVVETKRTFASKFSQRVQNDNETVEEYAADLKRLYSKAYQQRDTKTRQEDLVRKFLDGLKDNDARFEIEYNKEPNDIDEAVYHAINFIQTRRKSNQETFADKKYKKFVRRATEEMNYDTDKECCSDIEEPERAYRVPLKSERPATKKFKNQEVKLEKAESESDIQLNLLNETRDLLQTLVTQIAAIANGQQGREISQTRNNQPRRGVVCFKCKEEGHVIRDCPRKTAVTDDANTGVQSRGSVGNNRKTNNENTTGHLN